jgi:hypothetical protein
MEAGMSGGGVHGGGHGGRGGGSGSGVGGGASEGFPPRSNDAPTPVHGGTRIAVAGRHGGGGGGGGVGGSAGVWLQFDEDRSGGAHRDAIEVKRIDTATSGAW